jgi:hypothetical protein
MCRPAALCELVEHVDGDPADRPVVLSVQQDGPVVILIVGLVAQDELVAGPKPHDEPVGGVVVAHP